MTARPIIFGAQSVRAILAGTKTQTRRVVTPQPVMRGRDDCVIEYARGRKRHSGPVDYLIRDVLPRFGSPYGYAGHQLWVRETWRRAPENLPDGILYGADNLLRWFDGSPSAAEHRPLAASLPRAGPWRSPIHMPRWASRLTLEVTGLRVERLHEISEQDAHAEGCAGPSVGHINGEIVEFGPDSPIDDFQHGWDEINGKRAPWASNPWVWVVEFRRTTP